MTTLSPIFQQLIADNDNNPDVIAACEKGVFYVVAISELGGGQSIGSTEDSQGNPMPLIFCTRAEAQEDLDADNQRYLDDIEENERDEDDQFEGEILLAKWDGQSESMSLYIEELGLDIPPLYVGNWKHMAGL